MSPASASFAPAYPTAFGRAAAASFRWAATAGELLLLVWCIPAAILLIGLPLVVAIRLGLEIVERLFGR